MSDQAPGHGQFEELAAGYALDALEPADEQVFVRHARHCPACAGTLAGYREVAAALADTAPPAEPRPGLADRIMAAALADLGAGQAATPPRAADTAPTGRGPAGISPPGTGAARAEAGAGAAAAGTDPLPPHLAPPRPAGRRWLRPVLAAAAAALIAAGGIWGGLAATSSPGSQPPAAGCGHLRGCSQVTLTASATHREAGKVIVERGQVWMVPSAMKPDDTADQIYVLWQLTSGHRARAVGSFDVRPGSHAAIKVGGLAAPYASTLAFAVSLEHGRTIPPAPSPPVAVGQVS